MHVFFEHFRIYQVLTPQFINFLLTHKLVLVVHYLLLFFLKFLSDVFNVRHPFWGRSKLRNEKASNLWILQRSQNHTAVFDNCAHVDATLWFNTGKELPIPICDLELIGSLYEDLRLMSVRSNLTSKIERVLPSPMPINKPLSSHFTWLMGVEDCILQTLERCLKSQT